MTHLTQEEIILNYYRELDSQAHLDACAECRDELARITGVLNSIEPPAVPEPDDEYESRVWNRLAWRLRSEKKRSSTQWTKWLAAAAMLTFAFVGGLLMRRDATQPATNVVATKTTPATAEPAATGATTQQQRDRILLVVVGDHFDESERVLVELTNLTPGEEGTDITSEQQRAEELLASNRLYRRTASDRGEENVATLLDELEPVLMQIAHAPSQVSADELLRMQKRVEAKELVFKLRVVRAGVRTETRLPNQPSI
jgi:hypothetical protein